MRIRIDQHWVYFDIKTKWSAAKLTNKKALRDAAELNRQKMSRKNKKSVYASISHTRTAGGFAVATRPVGFDLELAGRKLSARASQRLGTTEEHHLCPSAISLWVMKEAAWKSLKGPHQPKTITKIKIQKVKKNKNKSKFLFSFKSRTISGLVVRGHGGLICKGRLILGFAVI
jgi:phosphopantetheinyl transferase (holo-ACP synthase)